MYYGIFLRMPIKTPSNRCAPALIMAQYIGKKAFKSTVRGHHYM